MNKKKSVLSYYSSKQYGASAITPSHGSTRVNKKKPPRSLRPLMDIGKQRSDVQDISSFIKDFENKV